MPIASREFITRLNHRVGTDLQYSELGTAAMAVEYPAESGRFGYDIVENGVTLGPDHPAVPLFAAHAARLHEEFGSPVHAEESAPT